ncbi:MAG: hypothetical protein JXA10_03460 [Anaerolineae bacterium]|nr:hypothetical protein [Anaerolineae bacterium]
MRLKASIKNHPTLDIAIIHQENEGEGYFLYVVSEDQNHGFDNWHPNLESAKYQAQMDYHIAADDWQKIPDVLPGALPTFEEPTVGIRDESGGFHTIPYNEALKRGLVPPQEKPLEIIDDPELIAEVRSYLAKNNPLRAIQIYLNHARCDLLTAKRVIEHLRNTES